MEKPLRSPFLYVNDTPLTERMKKDIEEIFFTYDTDDKGYLTKFEYKLAFIALMGFKPSKFERKQLFEGNKGISKSYFVEIMTKKLLRIDDQDRIRQIFNAFDKDRKGYISIEDFKEAIHSTLLMENIGKVKDKYISNFSIEMLYSEFDFEKNNRVNYSIFSDHLFKNKTKY
ncbi:hypothetical protein ABK040_008559 [Willaertia magna]